MLHVNPFGVAAFVSIIIIFFTIMWLVVICIVRVGHNVFLQICTHSVHKLLEMVPCCFFCPPPALILVASVSAMHLYWHDIYSPPLLLDIGRKY